jgi:hypothetical protein
MDSATYDKHWAVFEATAKPLMEALRARVQSDFRIDCGAVEELDLCEERALGFTAQLRPIPEDADNNVFVELLLIDGDEAGYAGDTDEPQVGVSFRISDTKNVEYVRCIPGNFTEAVGTSDAAVLVEKIKKEIDWSSAHVWVLEAWEQAFIADAKVAIQANASAAAQSTTVRTGDISPSP